MTALPFRNDWRGSPRVVVGETVTVTNTGGAGQSKVDDTIVNDGLTIQAAVTNPVAWKSTRQIRSVTSTSLANHVGWSFTPVDDFYVTCHAYLTTAPGTSLWVLRASDSATLGEAKARLGVTTGRAVMVSAAANTVLWTSTTLIPTGQWVRLELRVKAGTTTGGVEARIFLNPEGATPDEVSPLSLLTGQDTGAAGSVDGLQYGNTQNNNSGTHYFGPIQVQTGGYAGPYAGPGNPEVDAGPDQVVAEGATVTFAGSGTDIDGTVVGYAWRHFAGAALTLSSTTVASPTGVAPAGPATVVKALTVTDNAGLSSVEDTVTVAVTAPPGYKQVKTASGFVPCPVRVRRGGVWT